MRHLVSSGKKVLKILVPVGGGGEGPWALGVHGPPLKDDLSWRKLVQRAGDGHTENHV